MNERRQDASEQFETYSREREKVYEQTMQFNPIVKFFFMILEDSINSKFMRLLCPKKFSPVLCQVGSCSCQSFCTTQILESSPFK